MIVWIPLHPQMEVTRTLPVRSPAEVLQQDYLRARGISLAQLARMSGIPIASVRRIASGQRVSPISPGIALRLAAVFGTSALYWLALQARYDLDRKHSERERVWLPDEAMQGGAGRTEIDHAR
ncbi:HigA family addiction module antitoxin [Dyella silvae]|uniref:HigA family addiction module antitoxin n=1 Tax=Dyella silvae TaxID=2994424 RepID=UPI002264C31E|nr:HigA family addiction module antitoxin [Dyella silvae]